MRLATVLLLVLVLAALVHAQETAASVTERGRSLGRALDLCLVPDGKPPEGARTLVLLVDATDSLQRAGFSRELGGALERSAPRLGATLIGVARVGDAFSLSTTNDHAKVLAAVETALATPKKTVLNVYADVRRVAHSLASRPGRKDVVLVTLENGDAEDNLEATVAALRRARVRLFLIARQAFLSDSYWINRAYEAPRGLTATGSDGAFVEVPWGWLWQMYVANETVPSGFAMYGLSRLAQESGGRVYLHYPASTAHKCSVYGGCVFCATDHIVTDQAFRAHRLAALAPAAGPRAAVLAAAARDPVYKAVLKAWKQASRDQILRSRPSLKGGRPERRQLGQWKTVAGLGFARHAHDAEKLARSCARIASDLERDLERAKGGSRRSRAIGEMTYVMLHITRVNLLALAAWAREVAPVMAGKVQREYAAPERPWYSKGQRFVGIAYSNMCLCHGVEPFLAVRLPGGDAFKTELRALDAIVGSFLRRYAHTPFGLAVRRSGLARYSLGVRGKPVPPPEREVPGTERERTRTPRSGTGDGGGGGGTTSGGG